MKSFDNPNRAVTVRERFFPAVGFAACALLLLITPACVRSQRALRIYMPATLLIGQGVPTLAEGKWFHSDGATSTDFYRGRVVVLQFGFTACASCAEFAPRFKGVIDKYTNRDVVVIHVMDGRLDDEKSIRRYIKDREVKGPVVLDVNGEIFERLKITSSPSVFVVNGAGRILWWQATVREALVDEWILEAIAQNRKASALVAVDAG